MLVGKLELVYRFTVASNGAAFSQTKNESAGTPTRSEQESGCQQIRW